jgi:sRNA-binding protein
MSTTADPGIAPATEPDVVGAELPATEAVADAAVPDDAVTAAPAPVPAVADEAVPQSPDTAAGGAAETAETADATIPTPARATRAPEMSPAACADLLKQHFPALFATGAKPLKLRIQTDIQQRAPGVFTKGALSAFFRRYTGSTGYLLALSKSEQRFDLDGQAAGELSEEHRQLAREELTRRRQLTREREQQARAAQRAQQQPQPPQIEGAGEARPEGATDTRRRDQPPRPPRPSGPRPDRPPQRGAPGGGRPPQDRSDRPANGRGPGPRPDRRPDHRPAPVAALAETGADRADRPVEAVARPAAPPMSTESLEALQARQARHALLRDFDRTPLTLANFCALKGLKPDALAPMLELARKEAAALPPVPAQASGDHRGLPGPQRDSRRDERRDDRRDDRRPGPPGDRTRPAQDARGGPRPDPRRPRGPTGQS